MESGIASCFDDEFMGTILGEFLDESQGYLTDLNDNLLVLDELVSALDDTESPQVDLELLNTMFRAAHSMKGLSAMLQLDDINRLTHNIENVFDAARNNSLSIRREVVDVMFQAFDRLTGMVSLLSEPGGEELPCDEIITEIQMLLDDIGVADSHSNRDEPADESQGPAEDSPAHADGAKLERAPEETAATDDDSLPLAGETTSDPTMEESSLEDDPFADVTDEIDLSDKYLSIFLEESETSLDALSEVMLADDHEVLIDRALVLCHQVKGAAATVRLNRVAKLSHFMEDLLQQLRDDGHAITTDVVDAVIFSIDSLRTYLQMVKNDSVSTDTLAEAYRQLKHAHAVVFSTETGTGPEAGTDNRAAAKDDDGTPAQEPEPTEVARADHLTDSERSRAAAAAPSGQSALLGMVLFEDQLPLVELKAKLVIERLTAMGDLFYCDPDESQLEETTGMTCLVFGVASECHPEFVRRQIDLAGVVDIKLETVAPPQPDGSPANSSVESASPLGAAAAADSSDASSPNSATAPPADSSARPSAAPSHDSETGRGADTCPVTSASPVPEPAAPVAAPPAAAVAQSSAQSAAPLAGSPRPPEKAPATNRAQNKPAETIRVDIDRLDQLMNLAGQLVINKARFGQISGKLKGLSKHRQGSASLTNIEDSLSRLLADTSELGERSSGDLVYVQSVNCYAEQIRADLEIVRGDMTQLFEARNLLNDLSEAVHQLDRVSDGIQTSVMDTRMVPIGPLFGRFKRVIRDITRMNGKEIQLVIRGEKTELDKRMIDELGDPLIHMIRNSADHGIESPEEREAAGKPRQGTVTLDAFHRGNRILIQVRDNGKGLDSEKIREKAIAKGIISAADAERLTPQQTYQLIWEPGFSTAEQITEVSGRGMGMDIVRSKIEQISGTVELDSQVGIGTTITIKLPLTMAILPSLLTVVSGSVYAVPVESVVEIVRFKRTELVTVHGHKAARVRGRVVSVVELSEVLEWNEAPHSDEPFPEDITLVIIGSEESELALSVDDLLGEEDIVIKSLAENFRNVSGIAGASILGDGRVSLILDVSALLDLVCSSKPSGNAEVARAGLSLSGN